MKLLISPTDETEAAEAIAGGANIVDVKNPREGALGASFPWVIRRVKEIAPTNVEVSCTIGDPSSLLGAATLTALGAATTGVDYIKVGLRGVKTKEDAVYMMRNISRAAKECKPTLKVVVVGYADAHKVGSVNPMLVPQIAGEAELDVAMLDTAVKNGSNLFASLSPSQLSNFVESSHDYGLKVAVAGSLSAQDLQGVYSSGADIVGLRGAACTGGDRVNGRIRREKVQELADIVCRLASQDKMLIAKV